MSHMMRQAVQELQENGFAILTGIFSLSEIAAILSTVEAADTTSVNFRRSQDVFAIRNLLGEIPALREQLLTPTMRQLLAALFPDATPHLTKAIYFDKPAGFNWLVAWHQDVMIAVWLWSLDNQARQSGRAAAAPDFRKHHHRSAAPR